MNSSKAIASIHWQSSRHLLLCPASLVWGQQGGSFFSLNARQQQSKQPRVAQSQRVTVRPFLLLLCVSGSFYVKNLFFLLSLLSPPLHRISSIRVAAVMGNSISTSSLQPTSLLQCFNKDGVLDLDLLLMYRRHHCHERDEDELLLLDALEAAVTETDELYGTEARTRSVKKQKLFFRDETGALKEATPHNSLWYAIYIISPRPEDKKWQYKFRRVSGTIDVDSHANLFIMLFFSVIISCFCIMCVFLCVCSHVCVPMCVSSSRVCVPVCVIVVCVFPCVHSHVRVLMCVFLCVCCISLFLLLAFVTAFQASL